MLVSQMRYSVTWWLRYGVIVCCVCVYCVLFRWGVLRGVCPATMYNQCGTDRM